MTKKSSPARAIETNPRPTSRRGWVDGGRRRLSRLRPHLLLVAAPVLFNLVALRSQLGDAMNLNDSALHLSLVRTARYQIDQGHNPLDSWYPWLSLGSPQFHHYQTLPHVLTAYVSELFGVASTYNWSLYLLLSLWPISVYAGARLMGWGRWVAATAALLSPFLLSAAGYGYETPSYVWRGLGVWTQLWGMWLLPLALGLSWRAVRGRGSYALAAVVLALTIACHFLTGYLALLALVLWVLVRPSEFRARLVRAIAVGGGALLIAAWVLVPLIADQKWSGNIQFYQGTFWFDSYGAPQVLRWLFTGEIFDSGRLPIVSALAAVGFAVCAIRWRGDERARALLCFFALSLLLFFGRPTLGPLLNVLPGGSDLPLHRYILGLHLSGLVLAGIGTVALLRMARAQLQRVVWHPHPAVVPAAVVALVAGALFPAWHQLWDYGSVNGDLMAAQQSATATDGADLEVLVNAVKSLGGGRVYAGTKANWGRQYTVGYVPVYEVLENDDVDAVGMWLNTESLSSDVEVQFDETNAADYELLGVRYLILPADHPPPVQATMLASSGRHVLYQVGRFGYTEVVDTVAPPITADRRDVYQQTAPLLQSSLPARHQLPTVAFAGGTAAPPTLTDAAAATTSPGAVVDEVDAPLDGRFTTTVTADRNAVVLLKSTYDPRWRVTVDGVDAAPIMVAPTFVGVPVAAGSHTVVFEYQQYPYYPELLAVGLLTVAGLVAVPRWWVRRRTGATARRAES